MIPTTTNQWIWILPVFSDYKENDGNVVQPFMYEPLASESSSDDSCSNTSGDGSDSSHEDSARLGNTDW